MLPAAVVRAAEALEERNLDELENGRHELDEEGMFLLVQDATTREIADSNPEAHREHADIQIVLKGAERFGFAPADAGLVALEDRLDSGDIALSDSPPRRVHRPRCRSVRDLSIRATYTVPAA